MTCVIICSGRIYDYEYMKKYLQGADIIISADGGARHCAAFNILPDLLVGDFDSVSEDDFEGMSGKGVGIVRYPAEKDKTDSELAVDIALERGCKKIILLGAIGSRIDHSVSNLFLLKKLTDISVEGIIADEKNEVRIIKDNIELAREDGVFVTLLPFAGNAGGVTTRGLYYPLNNAVLKTGSSLGVSNRFSADMAQISVRDGYLLVIMSRD